MASWFAHVVTLLIGFFLMPYVLKTIGNTSYGTWLFLSSVAGYSGLLYLGFGQTISRFTSKYRAEDNYDRLNQIGSCILLIYACMGAIAFLFGVGFALLAPYARPWTGQSVFEIQCVLFLLGANASIGLMGSVYGGLLIGSQRFDIERGIMVSTGVLRAALTLMFLHQEWELVTLASIFLAVTIVENILFYYYAHKAIPQLSLGFNKINRDAFHECVSFNGYNLVSLLAEYLMYRTDTIVIGVMMGPATVVPYSIASRLCQMIREPIAQVGEVFLPKAGELHAQDEHRQLASLVYKGMGFAFLLSTSVLIGGYWFGPLLIETWVGKGYEESASLLTCLMLGQIISLPMVIVRRVLLGMGQIRLPSIALLGAAILNISLAITLIPPFGLWGMIIGMVAPVYLIELCVILPIACRKLKLSSSQIFYRVILAQAPALIALAIYSHYVSQLQLTASWRDVFLATAGGAGVVGLIWLPQQFPHRIKQILSRITSPNNLNTLVLSELHDHVHDEYDLGTAQVSEVTTKAAPRAAVLETTVAN